MTTILLLITAVTAAAAQQKKDLRYTVPPGSTLSIINDTGSIFVRAATGKELLISAAPFSAKVEVDGTQSGTRVEVRTHMLQKASGDEARVDYSVQLPAGMALVIRDGSGAVRVQNASADVSVDADTGSVEVSDSSNGHVHVRTLGASVILGNIRKGHVEVTSVSGELTLHNVGGPQVTASTTSAPIHFIGDCADGGAYSLSTHSGNIEVILPATASVDVTARSVNGSVEDGFLFQPSDHPAIAITPGKSFAGRANSGAASLSLRSFSGKITVKKQ